MGPQSERLDHYKALQVPGLHGSTLVDTRDTNHLLGHNNLPLVIGLHPVVTVLITNNQAEQHLVGSLTLHVCLWMSCQMTT